MRKMANREIRPSTLSLPPRTSHSPGEDLRGAASVGILKPEFRGHSP